MSRGPPICVTMAVCRLYSVPTCRTSVYGAGCETVLSEVRSQVKRDYPLNLSILLRGGKEHNYDALSNGE